MLAVLDTLTPLTAGLPGNIDISPNDSGLPGIAALFVGPYDLCLSMGLEPGKLHPELIAIYKRIAAAAEKHGFAMAIDVPSQSYLKTYRDLGFSLMTHGLDMQFLLDGSRQVTKTFKDAFKAG